MDSPPDLPARRHPGSPDASADLARLVALVPVRSLERAKTRLAFALDPEERVALAAGLTGRTIRVLDEARRAGDLAGIVVASDDPSALAAGSAVGAIPLPVGGHDLVADLRTARERAILADATAVLVVPTDLARISAAAVADVVAAGRRAAAPDRPLVVLVPDRAGEGTNALLVSPPRAVDFAFGPGSRARHAAAARAAGAVLVELDGPLALDVDTPEDLAAAPEVEAIADAVADAGPALAADGARPEAGPRP
jgi:2-phospho-L-lactate guanylyltransferase